MKALLQYSNPNGEKPPKIYRSGILPGVKFFCPPVYAQPHKELGARWYKSLYWNDLETCIRMARVYSHLQDRLKIILPTGAEIPLFLVDKKT